MAIGTGAAIALGASGAASAIGASKQASAAKKAAQTQTASADRAALLQYQLAQQALAAQREQYDATRQLYAPYTQTAPMSLAALNSFVLGGQSGYAQPVPPGGPPTGQQMYFPGAPQTRPAPPMGAMPPLPGGSATGGPPPGMMPPGGLPPGALPPGMSSTPAAVVQRRAQSPMMPMNQLYRG